MALWIRQTWDELGRAEDILDSFQSKVSEEAPIVAWDAVVPSFTGKGLAPLDRGYRSSDEIWEDKLKGTAADLSATLAEMDERLAASYGNQATTPKS